ncbi:MAG: hypothetical protein ABIJ96_04735 [Elusimicrobiota bacterium]
MHRVMLLGAALGIAASAQAQVASIPANRNWSKQQLDRVFDGAGLKPELAAEPVPGAPADKRILYPESDTPPAAPRFALNIDAVPAEFRHTVRGFEKLFHKNQEETAQQVDRINEHIRRHNEGRTFGRIDEWTYDGRLNEPVWNCLSHGAATANDWWSHELGKPIPRHESITHGGTEEGLDPYLLELEYFRRAGSEDPDYVVPPKFVQEDPVRHTGFPYEPRGYAKLLIEDEPYDVTDPITGKVYRYDPAMSAMEGEYKQLFTNSVFRDRTPAKYAKVLARGIDRWGIAYVQLEHTDHPRWPGAHAVAAVGYFCMEAGEKLIRCSANKTDEDWGRTTYFIAHDSFGDYPASQPRTAHTASAYRAVRITSIDQAIVFPHGLRVTLAPRPGVPGVWNIQVANKGGKPVDVLAIKALGRGTIETPVLSDVDGSYYVEGSAGDELRLYVEARHYFDKDGKGRGYAVELGAGPRTAVAVN